jgi:sulfite reductase (ferredoxin)
MSDESKPSAENLSRVDKLKIASNYLRGTIAEQIADGSDEFTKDNADLLKHFGTYQQDDRDARAMKRAAASGAAVNGTPVGKKGKDIIMMVRTKIPGGMLSSERLLAELDLCDEVGNGTLRITSRQGLQLHGVAKDDLQKTIARINEVGASTLGACGDVNRNVMCCPAPYRVDPVHRKLQARALELAAYFAPRTRAYHEIFLRDLATNENQRLGDTKGEEIEPIYGKQYLPRKFKIGIALPGDNCIDIYTHDLGFLAICRDQDIVGYNVLVGGGQGRTPSAEKTFPALGHRMCFIRPEQIIDAAAAVVKVQRDFGNRVDRKVARLKYLIHDWGLAKFKAKVEEYFGSPLDDPWDDDVFRHDDHMGWFDQGDGRWFYGLNVENGRIKDCEEFQMKTAFREICRRLAPGIRTTAHQGILFTDIAPSDRTVLEDILRKHRVPLSEEFSQVRRWSMACVAWPTCGLSITEAERALPSMMDQMEVELAKLGLADERFTVRMTGCPNGCARPYNCDIGLVGRAKDQYTIFVGGRLLGNRLNFEYKDYVPGESVVDELVPVFVYFKQARQPGESLGDFCHRIGVEGLLAFANEYQTMAA